MAAILFEIFSESLARFVKNILIIVKSIGKNYFNTVIFLDEITHLACNNFVTANKLKPDHHLSRLYVRK